MPSLLPRTPDQVDQPANLNPPQQEVIDRDLLGGAFSVVLQLPTGSGKTWLAEQAIADILRRGQKAIYLTPLRALANELLERWTERFNAWQVGVFTGEYGQQKTYPVPFERADLLVMTPERFDACTRNWRSHWRWLPEVHLLVIDEIHLLGEPQRGPRLEGALMRARALNPFMQLVGLSATLGNRAELADWMEGVHYRSTWRPIPVEWRYCRYRQASDKPEILLAEIQRCIESGGQSLVFVQSRRRAEMLSAYLRDARVPAGHHHAGLESQDRRRLEHEFRSGTLRALVSTGTLEMGMNLPARQVILYDLQAFDGTDFVPLTVNSVWQRAGRAGRRGLDTTGEVVLMSPSWDRNSDRYADGRFESVRSGLADRAALAEQVLVELSSGMARTRAQLERRFDLSLASLQKRLPPFEQVLGEMVDSGMVVEVRDDEERAPRLKATRLGRIAVRQMLSPATVVTLARSFSAPDAATLRFFDLLLLCVNTRDCEPLIPADFEELEEIGARLVREPNTLLTGTIEDVCRRVGCGGRRLLSIFKTALIARAWTRVGCAESVAQDFGCYAYEVRRLTESLGRILTAAVAVVTPPKEKGELVPEESAFDTDRSDEPSLAERVRALMSMVGHGLDEQTVTLTYLDGVGGKLARRLRDAGFEDIEDIAQAECDAVAAVRGVSTTRATRWIALASETLHARNAFSLREAGGTSRVTTRACDLEVDPYRLRRALDLEVLAQSEYFVVSGGLEPHRIFGTPTQYRCDCADFANGHECKHVLAVRLARKDPQLLQVVEQLSSPDNQPELDLFRLWFDREKR